MIIRKNLFLPVLLLVAVTGFAQAPPTANTVMNLAMQRATREHKNVFIIFHASWCGWCHRMDSLMNSAECRKFFADNYVVEHLTVMESKDNKNLENAGGEEVLKKYNGEKQGIPFWLVFDAKGNLLADCQMRPDGAGLDTRGENTGCPATKEEVAHFIKVLKKTSSLKADQLAVIEKKFIKE
jgi:thiol-disulfide isomerase/thioredoxin